ncbi:thioredoxin-like 1-1, chloroplastic isoform X1 [Solanum tuberosum]|nr:PREDICTED: thioredoxin-like 1-1, chloroplastic isoform X1 [Solanum tuberosum]
MEKVLNKAVFFPSILNSSNIYQYNQHGVCVFPMKFNRRNHKSAAATAQMSIGIRKAPKWWEKGLQPNMKEVMGAQDLADTLLNAGDKLVVVDFLSPGCGGCKALHPKICQLAEMNPDVQFLHVNYEEHKSMCYSLNVHVLPFFRFYRGAEGRLCSFSCTNATIKKFKDALTKYGADCCSLEPVKGLEEKELLALAANKDLSFAYTPKTEEPMPVALQDAKVIKTSRTSSSCPNTFSLLPLPLPLPLASTSHKAKQDSKSEVF